MITNGFTYVAFLIFFAGSLVLLEKKTHWKIFEYIPPVVMLYLGAMLLCTVGLWDMKATQPAYGALKNNLLYAMVFVMLLRCDIRKILKLGPRMLGGFFAASFTIGIGFIGAYALFHTALGAGAWKALGALCGSWLGGSGNMIAIQAALDINSGDMAYALVVDSIDYSIWVMLKRVRQNTKVPLVFLTYINPIFTYGCDKFFKNCRDCDISGVIIPDVPFEEKGEVAGYCKKYGVDLISLIAPTSEQRIKMIARDATGYIYLVSSLGVTGVRTTITTDIGAIVEQIRQVTKVPIAVGFGIATPEQAEKMAKISDGAIVGSAIVKIVAANGDNCVKPVADYVRTMVEAVATCR